MRLHSLIAKNYRTLHDITLAFPMNYCAVSGRNNAGKSCVIRLLSALFGISDRYPWIGDDFRFDYKEGKGVRYLFDFSIQRGKRGQQYKGTWNV